MSFNCPKCQANQVDAWLTPSPEEMEGREWRCPNCHATLMLLLGQITEVHIPRTGGSSPLPPGAPSR
jgi:hypothetical protein